MTTRNSPELELKTQDGKLIVPGMVVWLYPANERKRGTIRKATVATVSRYNMTYSDHRATYHPGWRIKIFSTEEAAAAAKKVDLDTPKWIYNGHLSLANCAMAAEYIKHETGVEVVCNKTERYFYVVWHNSEGMQREKIRCPGGAVGGLREQHLEPLFKKLRATNSITA